MDIKEKHRLTEYRDFIKKYKDYDQKIGNNKEIRELVSKILKFVHNHIKEMISEVLYERYQKNLNKKKKSRKKEISFLSTSEDIKKDIIEPIFAVKLKNRIIEEIDSVLADIKLFDPKEFVQNEMNTYCIEIITDPYTYSRYQAYFYFDQFDEEIIDGYLNTIYREVLVPFLKEKYDISDIFKVVNTEKFAICSPNDFEPEHCINPIARKNILNLVSKLIELITNGAKLLEQDEITKVYEIKLIMDMVSISIPKGLSEQESELENAIDNASPDDQITDQIKEHFRVLLKGSVKASNEYIGFFRKEDYISWLLPKYREVGYDRLEKIFNSVVNPKPPTGVIKFVVPIPSTGERYYYFISMEEITVVFRYMEKEKQDKTIEDYTNIKRHHFFMFLKQMFKELEFANYTEERIAKYFAADVRTIRDMKKYLEKHGY